VMEGSMMEGTRAERRSGSRRSRVRVSREKVERFLRMRQQGKSRGVMAAATGLRPAVIAELEVMVERGEGGEANNA